MPQMAEGSSASGDSSASQVRSDRRIRLLEHFQRLGAPTFDGTEGPESAEHFMHQLEKIFRVLKSSEEDKLVLAEFQLRGEADDWWEVVKTTLERELRIDGWQTFKDAFLDRFFPESSREAKGHEFEVLVQGKMNLERYGREFTRLSKYAPHLVSTQNMRARKFERGVNPPLKAQLVALNLPTFEEVLRRGLLMERSMKEDRVGESQPSTSTNFPKRFKQFCGGRSGVSSPSKRPSTSGTSGRMERARTVPPQCPRCARRHFGTMCYGNPVTCFECGQPGHIRWNCPQRMENVSATVQQPVRGPRPAGSSISTRGSATTSRGRGRVGVLTYGEPGTVGGMIEGEILVDGRSAHAMFDTGATHSFVSEGFVPKMLVDRLSLDSSILMHLPAGITYRSRRMHRGCEIMVGSLNTVADLLELELDDYDVILGMDWMERYYAKIDCARREIVLEVPSHNVVVVSRGDSVGIITFISARKLQRGVEEGEEAFLAMALNLTYELPKLQEIRVVKEF